MKLKVLTLFATVLLSNLSLCHNAESSRRTRWRVFPLSGIMPDSRVGKQMPPHHEPDAVLINVGGGNGHPGLPGGGNAPRWPQPGGPGVFVPGGPGVFGVPGMPGVYGVPQGPSPRPGVFGFPDSQNFPNGFGAPGGFMPPRGPGVFATPRQDNPFLPNGPDPSGIPVGHNGHGFPVGTGGIGVPNGHPGPNEPTGFGNPTIFTVAGGGNVPVSAVPGYFVPGQNPNFPGNGGGVAPGSFPGNGGGMLPGSLTPGGTGRFGPGGGTYPGVFFPDSAAVPPVRPGSFGGSFPGKEFHGSEGGRELNDDPVADMFPIIDKEPLFYKISS